MLRRDQIVGDAVPLSGGADRRSGADRPGRGRIVAGRLSRPARRGIQPTAITPAVRPGAPAAAARRKKATAARLLYLLKGSRAGRGRRAGRRGGRRAEDATEHPGLAAAYSALHHGLRRGEKFCYAFARCFPAFPPYIHRIIEAGEMTGRLGEALADAAARMEHEAQRSADEMRNALIYPGLPGRLPACSPCFSSSWSWCRALPRCSAASTTRSRALLRRHRRRHVAARASAAGGDRGGGLAAVRRPMAFSRRLANPGAGTPCAPAAHPRLADRVETARWAGCSRGCWKTACR